MVDKSNRKVSLAQEKRIAKAIGARRTPNSGATHFDKGDLYIGQYWLIEAKTCKEPKKSFTIKREWLTKLKEEQYATHKDNGALCFDFGDGKDRFYVIDESTFQYLIELSKGDME